MRPVPHSDGYDVPPLVDEPIPSVAAVIDDVLVGFEDAIGQHGVLAGRDNLGDFLKVQVHRLRVAQGQNEARALAVVGTDRAEDVGRGGALIVRSRWPRPPLGPATCDLVLLADSSLVAEPDFQRRGGWRRPSARSRVGAGGKLSYNPRSPLLLERDGAGGPTACDSP